MNLPRILVPIAVLLFAGCRSTASVDTDATDAVAWRPQPQRTPVVVTDHDNSPNVLSPLPPGTRIALAEVPTAGHGIPLPDGTCLPALNGVARSGRLKRPADQGPLAPVVGILVDASHFEWYEHQDGSMTTSRWVWKDRLHCWEPMTFHAIAQK